MSVCLIDTGVENKSSPVGVDRNDLIIKIQSILIKLIISVMGCVTVK